ncbi:MAG: thiamine pyrophosphate-dependent enzyme, partial [Pseudomonadota bacterium]
GDGIASRAVGYGMHAIRVDGNDLAAVFSATQAARNLAIAESKPVLVEAMTYRIGHHSTSDDSTAYRSADEINQWKEDRCPVRRTRGFLEAQGLWTEEMERQARREERIAVMKALETAEARPKPPLETLFTDVYADMPKHLQEQYDDLLAHLDKHPVRPSHAR